MILDPFAQGLNGSLPEDLSFQGVPINTVLSIGYIDNHDLRSAQVPWSKTTKKGKLAIKRRLHQFLSTSAQSCGACFGLPVASTGEYFIFDF